MLTMDGPMVPSEPLETATVRQKPEFSIETELRIAFVGKPGVGKSATANNLIGEDYFQLSGVGGSMTKICKFKKARILERDMLVIDTPGICDTETDSTEVENEITKCVQIGAPGLHAVLFVMEANRFRKEDEKTIRIFRRLFQWEMKDRVIVLFTHGDDLQKYQMRLEEFLENIPMNFRVFINDCQNRCILFNNKFNREESYQQISDLLTMIEALKRSNEIAFYSGAIYRKEEERIQLREKEIDERLTQKYQQKQKDFEQTLKTELEGQMRQEQEAVIEKVKNECEEKLKIVMDEIRKEISDKESKCAIL